MVKLNLPEYKFRIKKNGKTLLIFDDFRKKFVVLTPEEWVRQNIIRYLIEEKKFPSSLVAVEMGINLNNTAKRCDVVSFNRSGNPLLIVECKAPQVKINQSTFDQIFTYNLKLKVKYLLVTNGLNHYFACFQEGKEKADFLTDIPCFDEIA